MKRGLRGTRLVISDAHEGLKQAIAEQVPSGREDRPRASPHGACLASGCNKEGHLAPP